MQFVVGHSIRTPSEEQGKNGYLGRQLDVTDSESFSQSHSNAASSPIPRLTSDQPQGREGGRMGRALILSLERPENSHLNVTALCGWRHSYCWECDDPHRLAASSPGHPKVTCKTGSCSINPGMPRVGGDLFPGCKQQVQASGPAPTALAVVFYLIAASALCQRM